MPTGDALSRTFRFNDVNVRVVLDSRGDPWWVAADVCRVLDIAKADSVMRRLEADEKGTHTVSTPGGPQQMGTVNLPGLNRLIASSRKPEARQFQRWLFHEVLPAIYKTGSYSLAPVLSDSARKLQLAEAREARLDRQLKQRALKDLVKTLRRAGRVSEEVISTYEIAAVEIAVEQDFSALKPPTEDTWESPTRIAERLGVSAQKVGRTITKLGLRGNLPGLARAIVNKAQGHNKTVTSYVYSPEAVGQIEAELREKGGMGEPSQ